MRPDFIVGKMKDCDVWRGIEALKKKERALQAHFIAYLAEIDRRQLFAVEAVSSVAWLPLTLTLSP